jgi:hypothetical protein
MCAQFLPADHSKGDPNTIGGYAAVHDRPAAFEGSDGFSYSVEIMTQETGDRSAPWGAFLLFVQWARLGAQSPEGHVETDFLATAGTEGEARRLIGETPLSHVKELLDAAIAARRGGAAPKRRWWDAMRDDEGSVT